MSVCAVAPGAAYARAGVVGTACGSLRDDRHQSSLYSDGSCDDADTGPDLQLTEDKPPAKKRPRLWRHIFKSLYGIALTRGFQIPIGKKKAH